MCVCVCVCVCVCGGWGGGGGGGDIQSKYDSPYLSKLSTKMKFESKRGSTDTLLSTNPF